MNKIKIEIENQVYSFFKEMKLWEKLCNEVDNDDSLTFEEQELKQISGAKKIVQQFLTQKERKRGLPNNISYGDDGSYTYNPDEEKIVDIEIDKNTAIVSTEREKPMEEKNKYVLKNKNNKWLIDSKKSYSSWKNKWENSIL